VTLDHRDVPASLVGATVQREWGVDVTAVEQVRTGDSSTHWVLGDDGGPQWLATLDRVSGADDRRALLAAYGVAADLTRRLSFVVGPVHSREGWVAVGLTPGLLLSLAPLLEGAAVGTRALVDDAERCVLANMMGDLHRQPLSRRLPGWRPVIGRLGQSRREELERCLGDEAWSGGPWAVPAQRLVSDARVTLLAALRRFSMLGAAIAGSAERWVVTHGEADAAHLVRTPDGHRLVGWGAMARAPRERDLAAALGKAEGNEPWYAYLEAGGTPEPLSADTVELFALQRHLSEVTQVAVRLAGPHPDTAQERDRFERLEEELDAVLARWS
jgi:spectinomycin phosphotransferase